MSAQNFDTTTVPIVQRDPFIPGGHRPEVICKRDITIVTAKMTGTSTEGVYQFHMVVIPDIVFKDCVRGENGSGEIVGAHLIDKRFAGNTPTPTPLAIWVYDSPIRGNGGYFIPIDSELDSLVGIIRFPAAPEVSHPIASILDASAVYYSGGMSYPLIGYPFRCTGGSKDLYGQLVATDECPSVANEKFTIRLAIKQF